MNISGTGAFVSVERKLTQDDDCNCLPWSFFGDWNARRSGTHYSQLRREWDRDGSMPWKRSREVSSALLSGHLQSFYSCCNFVILKDRWLCKVCNEKQIWRWILPIGKELRNGSNCKWVCWLHQWKLLNRCRVLSRSFPTSTRMWQAKVSRMHQQVSKLYYPDTLVNTNTHL